MKKAYCFCESLSQKLADDKPLNLSEKFWLMHISHSYFDKLTKKVPKEKITAIKTDIVKNYSNIFNEDFKHFKANILNELYNELFKEGHCTSSLEKEIALIKQNHSNQKIIVIFLEIISKIEEIHKCVESLKEYELPELLKQMNFEFPSHKIYSDVKFLEPFFENRQNAPAFYDDQKFTLIHDEISKLKDKIEECTNLIECLILDFSDDDFKKIEELEELKFQQTFSYLKKFEYAIDVAFNLELIFLFLWTDYQKYDEGRILTLIIKKYENFFLDIYNQITKVYSGVNELLDINWNFCPNEIVDNYLHPPIFKFFDPHCLLFRLKKIIKFYFLFHTLHQIKAPESIVNFLRLFDSVLTETKFFDISYNTFLDNLPAYIMKSLGINQTELAIILDIHKSSVSRQYENGTILKKNLWFWKTTTDFTLTFFNGHTTIPYYGKHNEDENYLYSVVLQTAFAEIFLQDITKLKEHLKNLKKNNPRSSNLTKFYLKQISQKTIQLKDIIGQHRLNLDALYKKINSASQEFSTISKEFGKKFPEDVENSKKQLDETKQQFQSYLDALVKNLDSCINKLQYETP